MGYFQEELHELQRRLLEMAGLVGSAIHRRTSDDAVRGPIPVLTARATDGAEENPHADTRLPMKCGFNRPVTSP